MRAACEGFPGGWGSFPGLCSLSLRLLLYAIYRFVQCKMQKLPRKQKAMLPPAIPPGSVYKSHLLFHCGFLPEAAGIIYSFCCTVSWFQQEGGIVPF